MAILPERSHGEVDEVAPADGEDLDAAVLFGGVEFAIEGLQVRGVGVDALEGFSKHIHVYPR